mmetsp:Transcript_7596/g.17363  ORF Transcript_7596/g.17363 Transcript_7596/m.17363 type:complete len:615 (-) Transcript_7596:726-2570(-)
MFGSTSFGFSAEQQVDGASEFLVQGDQTSPPRSGTSILDHFPSPHSARTSRSLSIGSQGFSRTSSGDPTRSPRLQAAFIRATSSEGARPFELGLGLSPEDLDLPPEALRWSSFDTEPGSIGPPSGAEYAALDKHAPHLGTWTLVGLVYYAVSGGPLGLEVAVAAGGPVLALAGFLAVPFLWGAAEAAMTTELAIAFPEAAGYCAWLNAAFGPYAAFVGSMLHYSGGLLDNSIYPVLFFSYLKAAELPGFPAEESGGLAELRLWVVLSFTAVGTWLTWRGLDVNGSACFYLTAVVLLPFLVFSILGLPQVDPRNWLLGPDGTSTVSSMDWADVQWAPLLNCLFWNLNYFDSASCFSGDLAEPAKTLPRAMALTLGFVSMTYILPLAVATGAAPQADYCDGCLVKIASEVVGPWLGCWITVATACGCIGLFIAEMAADSFQVMGMADQGQLPAMFSDRSKYGTPTVPIGIAFCAILVGSNFDFTSIIEMCNITYIFAQFMQIAALVKLRKDRPNMPRPWKVPAKTPFGTFLAFCPALMFLSSILYLSPTRCFALLTFVLTFSTLAYVAQCVIREREWIEYHPIQGKCTTIGSDSAMLAISQIAFPKFKIETPVTEV